MLAKPFVLKLCCLWSTVWAPHSRSNLILVVKDVLGGRFSFAISQARPSEDRLPQRREGVIYVKPKGFLLQHSSPNQVSRPRENAPHGFQPAPRHARGLRSRAVPVPEPEAPAAGKVGESRGSSHRSQCPGCGSNGRAGPGGSKGWPNRRTLGYSPGSDGSTR